MGLSDSYMVLLPTKVWSLSSIGCARNSVNFAYLLIWLFQLLLLFFLNFFFSVLVYLQYEASLISPVCGCVYYSIGKSIQSKRWRKKTTTWLASTEQKWIKCAQFSLDKQETDQNKLDRVNIRNRSITNNLRTTHNLWITELHIG